MGSWVQTTSGGTGPIRARLYSTSVPILIIPLLVAPLVHYTARMSPYSLPHLLQAVVTPDDLHCGIMSIAWKVAFLGDIIVLFHSFKLTSLKHYLNDHIWVNTRTLSRELPQVPKLLQHTGDVVYHAVPTINSISHYYKLSSVETMLTYREWHSCVGGLASPCPTKENPSPTVWPKWTSDFSNVYFFSKKIQWNNYLNYLLMKVVNICGCWGCTAHHRMKVLEVLNYLVLNTMKLYMGVHLTYFPEPSYLWCQSLWQKRVHFTGKSFQHLQLVLSWECSEVVTSRNRFSSWLLILPDLEADTTRSDVVL